MPLAVATGLFVSLASFSSPPTMQGPTGNPTGSYVAVAGLQSIPCMDAPMIEGGSSSDETKALSEIEAKRTRHILLNTYYAQVSTAAGRGWQVTVDGVLYDLLGGESDSQRTQTRCSLQLVGL